MSVLIRILLAAGILCLGMNFIGVVVAYYATLSALSSDPDASVDVLVDRSSQVQQNPWPVSGWTILGAVLIASAIGLAVFRGRLRVQRRKPV
jgi:hypothetical protein